MHVAGLLFAYLNHRVKRPQARHAGQSVTTFGTSNLPLQSIEGDDATGAKVDIGDWNDCGSIEV